MKVFDTLDLLASDVVLARHSAWLPSLEVKVPFQFGGRITKNISPNEGAYPIAATLPDEIAIFKALAQQQMAPSIGDLVYFKNVISSYPGSWWCDPLGAYGFEIADANKLPPGRFSFDDMRHLPIEGSEGAWGDVKKDGNTINGYLVDVRRTAWDMLRWKGPNEVLRYYEEDEAQLEEKVRRLCQFPKGERTEPYQDYWINNRLIKGSRSIEQRANLIGFLPRSKDNVLDLGCQTGGMLQYSYRRQSEPGLHVGIDIDTDYINCARDIARASKQNICYRQLDVVTELDQLVTWSQELFEGPPDHLLLLSMEKHIGSVLWDLVDALGARRTYIETNAVKPGQFKLKTEIEARGGSYVGDSTDRNTRRLYVISS